MASPTSVLALPLAWSIYIDSASNSMIAAALTNVAVDESPGVKHILMHDGARTNRPQPRRARIEYSISEIRCAVAASIEVARPWLKLHHAFPARWAWRTPGLPKED